VAGQVKTRLSPPLTPEQAADLYRAMLLDVLDQHATRTDVELVVWYTPRSAFEWFRASVPSRYRLLPQYGSDLGARMAHLFRVHHAEGYSRIVLRGTDSPTLPGERIREALERLETAEVVLCPDLDGGYNLIGLRAPCDALFSLEYSHSSVFEQTVARARAAGLSVAILPAHHDVDTGEDLERLSDTASEAWTPRTLHWLQRGR
jgi:rSAM/selenodomain-associated transferase 1